MKPTLSRRQSYKFHFSQQHKQYNEVIDQITYHKCAQHNIAVLTKTLEISFGINAPSRYSKVNKTEVSSRLLHQAQFMPPEQVWYCAHTVNSLL